jgi:penicillin-binding protein 2
MTVIFVVMGALTVVYLTTLYKLQVYDAGAAVEADAQQPNAVSPVSVVLPAQRGDILDRNGTLLVSNRPSYNVTLARKALLAAGDTNGIIKELIYTAEENGVRYNDTLLPVTRGAPFEYLADMSDTQRGRLDKYLDNYSLDRDISASELIAWMKEHYKLDYTTGISDARLIIGVRYELEIRVIPTINIGTYVFAEDVDVGFISIVKERAYPGVNIETTSVREYHTAYAAHVLGTIGKLDKDYEKYSALGYPMDAVVGKTGAEVGFEQYLHGVDGAQTVTAAENGAIIDVNVTRTPEPGGNVYLSIDIGLQAYTENELAKFIDTINSTRSEDAKVAGGAVVAVSVKTGEVLAMASYPTYDLATYGKNVNALNLDPTTPVLNRATDGMYNPGSTFKMVTALAGLREGAITRWSQINDTGQYTRHNDFRPYCWIFPQTGAGHGLLNVVEALRDSCNYFFYQVGDSTDKYALANAAADFGLGVPTGIEIPEITGTLATPEYKMRVLNEGWWDADTLLASIGQGHNMFTPLQLAGYAATIASGGQRRATTILSRVKSADYSANIVTQEPKTLGVIAEGDYIEILQEGMAAAARSGTAAPVFKDYKVSVAAKTGTVQMDASDVNNGMFVCYAPADDPEIAISVAIEKGGSGAAIMEIARTVLDYYYRDQTAFELHPEGALIP